MTLFIAEKPELGRAISAALPGKETNKGSFIIKDQNIITWAFGHMLEQSEPHEYDERYKDWLLNDLPFEIPLNSIKYRPIERSKEQLKTICKLINDSRVGTIVHCGDADDEGQILIDEILFFINNKKPVKRLLINDLTEAGVRKSLGEMRDNREFFGLSERGFARSQADWVVGLNLTRAYTIIGRKNGGIGFKEVVSLGRVQTPILGLIVARDEEHTKFKKMPYFSISGSFKYGPATIKALLKTEEKITNEAVANNIKTYCEGKSGVVKSATTEHRKEYPPLPYSLLILQAECSKLFGLKPDKTLEITQSLREKHHLITYNRSDCQYLPTTVFDERLKILPAIEQNLAKSDPQTGKLLANCQNSIKGPCFNDNNITAHHGIIPTSQRADMSTLTKDELNVYTLIARRFVVQFYPPREFDNTKIIISVAGSEFFASQNIDTFSSFADFYNKIEVKEEKPNDDEDVENTFDLRKVREGDGITCSQIFITKKETKPKPLYTMATLLKDLTGVAKYCKDERIKRLLLEKDQDKKGENGGIGTPATRSEHLKKLIERKFITVSDDKKQTIRATDRGKELIANISPMLATPDLTALWFEEQKAIERGEKSRYTFLQEVNAVVHGEIDSIRDNREIFSAAEHKCPKCGSRLIRRESKTKKNSFYWSCSGYKDGCDVGFFEDKNGIPVLEKQSAPRFTCPKCGGTLYRNESKKKKGQFYWSCGGYKTGCDIGFLQDRDGKPVFEKEKPHDDDIFGGGAESEILCPVCGVGVLKRHLSKKGKWWWGCSEWKSGCKAMYFDENGLPASIDFFP